MQELEFASRITLKICTVLIGVVSPKKKRSLLLFDLSRGPTGDNNKVL